MKSQLKIVDWLIEDDLRFSPQTMLIQRREQQREEVEDAFVGTLPPITHPRPPKEI